MKKYLGKWSLGKTRRLEGNIKLEFSKLDCKDMR